MRKLLSSLGLTVALLGSAILTRTQAQNQPSPFVVPAYAYQVTSDVTQFVDISSDPNTVQLNAGVTDQTDLKNFFFEATSETDATPRAKSILLGSNGTDKTEACFPMGFNFKISGTKEVSYFMVGALGSVYFSETPLRTNQSMQPSGAGASNHIVTIPYCQTTNGNSSAPAYLPDGKAKPASGKAPACYLISGTAGNKVLTVQFDYLLNEDEWVFQYKFYENANRYELIIKEIKTDHLVEGVANSYYEMAIGLIESGFEGYATAYDGFVDLYSADYLVAPALIGQTYHKVFYLSSTGFDTINQTRGYTWARTPRIPVKRGAAPEEGRRLTFDIPACNNPITPLPTSAYNLSSVDNALANLSATNPTFSATINYSTGDGHVAIDNGTIVAVLSNSETPDYTLADGTVYYKDHTFPAANGFTPTVLCNRYHKNSVNPTTGAITWSADNGSSSQVNYPIRLTVDGITPGVTRYIHLHRMVYTCDGAPKYSPVCHTIKLTQPMAAPQKLEIATPPTVNSVQVKAKSADGLKVIVFKCSGTEVHPSGNLKVGDKINGNAEVVALFEGEQTFNAALDADEKCYFVAFSVDNEYNYSPGGSRLYIQTRAAYNGIPGTIDMNSVGAAAGIDGYPGIPFGWTRAIEEVDGYKNNGFKIAKPDRYSNNALFAINPANIEIKDEEGQVVDATQISVQKHDIITPPIRLDYTKITVTYNVAWYASNDAGEAEVYEKIHNDKYQNNPTWTEHLKDNNYIVQYDFCDNNWQELGILKTNALPDKDNYGFYPFTKDLILDDGKMGQYIRFRYVWEPTARSNASKDVPIYHAIHYLKIAELKGCKTPTGVAAIEAQCTGSEIGISWNDPNTTPAPSYQVAYRLANTEDDWMVKTVNAKNAALTGLKKQTAYEVTVTAVCAATDVSEPTDPITVSTLRGFPYYESMAQDNTHSPFGDGGLATATGAINSMSTPQTAENAADAWAHNNSYTCKVQSNCGTKNTVGVGRSAANGWLLSPTLSVPQRGLPQVIRFTARSAGYYNTGGAVMNQNWGWHDGTVGTKTTKGQGFGNATLKVLVSNTGSFTTADVIATINVGSETDINNKTFEYQLTGDKIKEGNVRVALLFENPLNHTGGSGIITYKSDMVFEIHDLEYEYLGDVCPELEGLAISDVTGDGAAISWEPADVDHYTVSYGLADADGYTETFSVNDPTKHAYTITGLAESKTYKVKVVGYCDAQGTNPTLTELEGEFTTLESCHTPKNFKVEDITYNSAVFSSTPAEQVLNPLDHRLIYVEDINDATHVHLFKQTDDTFVAGMHDNRTVTVKTRAVCANGDSSAWSAPITFTTPLDPANAPDTFNIALKVQPEGAGTVTGAGRYFDDDEVSMTATANDGYVFVEWQDEDGKQVSANANRKWTATWEGESDTKRHDITWTAVFKKVYTITVAAQPAEGGTVTGNGNYVEGAEATLKASPRQAYKFTGWQKGDGIVSTDTVYKFTPTESATYTAVFTLKQIFTLDVTVEPDELGSVSFSPESENNEYQEGRVVTLTATPADGYCRFVAWVNRDNTKDTLSKEAVYTVTMDGNKNLKAVFAKIRYHVTLVSNPASYGYINGSSGSQSTGGTYEAGTMRRVVAKPGSGYEFVRWMDETREVGTDTVYTFLLERDITLTAYFKQKDSLDVKVTVNPANAGTVKGAGKVKRGGSVTLTATPAEHFAFAAWRRVNNSTITENPYTFTPERDYTFTAEFRALENYTVTVLTEGDGAVTGTGLVGGVGDYEEGSQVSLTATPGEHYVFTRWEVDGVAAGDKETYTFKATKNATVKAVFTKLDSRTVTVYRYYNGEQTPGAGTIMINDVETRTGAFDDGSKVKLQAIPAKGYKFKEWQQYADGSFVTDANPCEFDITSNISYRAVFEANVNIAVTVAPTGAGTVTGGSLYDTDDDVTLKAEADDDYVFVAWVNANDVTDTLHKNATYTFKAKESLNIKASFREKKYYRLSVPCIGSGDNDEDNLGSVSFDPEGDEGEYKEGETIKMKAVPADYCEFVEWRDENGEVVSRDGEHTFVITKDTKFSAVFTHTQYEVKLVSNPSTAGSIKGTSGSTTTGGTFNAGTKRRLVAQPRSGYEFVKWMEEGEELGTDTVYEFLLERDITITAYFKEKDSLNITLSVDPANAGTVTGAGKVKRGEDAVLTATANAAYKFVAWVNLAGDGIEANPYTFKPTRDYTFKAQFRAKEQYDITVTRVPNTGAGTVERKGFLSNGKAREDTTVTLTAKPAEGYTFTEWQDADGKPISTEATLSFKATANVTYRAVFAEIPTPEYTVTLLRDPEEGGSVRGDGTYEEGKEATITATPGRLYRFDGWYDATGKKVSTGTETAYKFTVAGDVTYTAKFTKRNTVDVDITVRLGARVDATVGTVTGAGEYAIGETVTLTATPASDDYVFSGWRDLNNDDELIGAANPFTFTAAENISYAAVFREEFEVTLNIDPDEHVGKVTGAGAYKETATATITATANEGYVFVAWLDENSREVSTDRTYEFTVSGNVTYTAKFVGIDEEHRHTIVLRRLPNSEAGDVSGAGRYLHGKQDTLRATPAANYLFVAWLKAKADDPTQYDTVSKANPYIFTVEGDSTYTALFRPRARYNIEVDILPNDNAGTVTGDGEHREGRMVTLTAEPAEGYVFVAWVNPALAAPRDTVSRNATYAFTATGHATYKAIFRRSLANYTVTLSTTPVNAGTVEGEGSYREGSTVTLTATPKAGYRFAGWRGADGQIVNTEPTYQFQITRNMTFVAVFRQKDIMTVTLNWTPENAGTVKGAGEYVLNAEATATAIPNRGYAFVAWQDENGETVSQDAAYKFIVTTDVTYTAVFEEHDVTGYTVGAKVLPNDGAGTVSGTGDYDEGETVTLTAAANAGYKFVQWQDADGNALGTDLTYTFKVTADVTYTALFENTGDTPDDPAKSDSVTVSLITLPNPAAGTVKGAGKYEKGKPVTIEAIPAANYTFVAWLDDLGEQVSTQATYTFTADADVTYTAQFDLKKSGPTANEQALKAAFNVAAAHGRLFIENLNGVVVREVAVFNTVGRRLAYFTPNSNLNLALPVDARYTVLVVRVVSEQGMAIYKVYLH